ncbi:hypothetical protein K469DRAFT_635181 [Zopfia rhizophila CBS 207.26]|uniref:Uncharacterized protein n=1 Tax=Zopfia rhizophila CBS 207.26 TaxID=1314779 RepID=A0A6A6DV47_9PEZI|nr:hypothetical protein K469DRAFT_635181 [Zopfia rhizophila CBS 207.26]
MDPGIIIAVVQLSAKIVSLLSEYSSDVSHAREDISRLRDEVAALDLVLTKVQKLAEGPEAARLPTLNLLVETIKQTSPELDGLLNKLSPGRTRKTMKRIGFRALKWPLERKDLDRFVTVLERQKCTIITALNTDQISLIFDINNTVTGLKQDVEQDRYHQYLAKLSPAEGASFRSYHRQHEPQCLPNTRVELLDQIRAWSRGHDRRILWLNGMAGTGKSTIARTVAETLAVQKRLGASFFFSRGGGDLGHASKFVRTLAYRLANISLPLRRRICEVIEEKYDIAQQALQIQWKELILRPLSTLNQSC